MAEQQEPEIVNQMPVTLPPWSGLRRFTDARIALGRAGIGLPTDAHLEFQLAHARARDAVYSNMDVAALTESMIALDLTVLRAQSAAMNRREYLMRPDKGRRLNDESRLTMDRQPGTGYDLVFVVADGLSATAINQNIAPFLTVLLPDLNSAGWRIGPTVVVEQGRVAIGDEIAHLLNAEIVVVMIGERPGLSSPDSLGCYLTYCPNPGITTDADRNCLSNIRPGGMSYTDAAARLLYLLTESRRRSLSGVSLKDETGLLPDRTSQALECADNRNRRD